MGIAVMQAHKAEAADRTLAADFMTSPAVVARESQTVHEVAQLMLREGVGAAPVLDAHDVPVGMVSDGDLSGRAPGDRRGTWWLELLAGAGDAGHPHGDVPVGKIMSSPLISVAPSAPIQEVAEVLRAHRIKRAPVVEDGKVVGVVSRSDLLRIVESAASKSAQDRNAANPLSFFESLIGGASLLGAANGRADPRADDHAKPQLQPPGFSAEAFRESVRVYKAEIVNREQLARREAELERRRQIESMLEQHLSGRRWREMLERATRAARAGEQEFMLFSFPSDLCSDGGRRIGVAEAGWPETLRGEAAQIHARWRRELKPQGFGLSARIVSFVEDGIIGDIGLYLTWGE